MIEAVDLGDRDHHRMVIAVAADKSHGPGAIGETEAERSFIEGSRAIDIDAVEVDMGEPHRSVAFGWLRRMAAIAMNEAQEATLWSAHDHRHAAIRRSIDVWGGDELTAFRPRLRRDGLEIAWRCHAERHCPQLGARASMQRKHMVVAAAGAQIDDIGGAGDELEAPDPGIELQRKLEIG